MFCNSCVLLAVIPNFYFKEQYKPEMTFCLNQERYVRKWYVVHSQFANNCGVGGIISYLMGTDDC